MTPLFRSASERYVLAASAELVRAPQGSLAGLLPAIAQVAAEVAYARGLEDRPEVSAFLDAAGVTARQHAARALIRFVAAELQRPAERRVSR
jgi:hypothetical protein